MKKQENVDFRHHDVMLTLKSLPVPYIFVDWEPSVLLEDRSLMFAISVHGLSLIFKQLDRHKMFGGEAPLIIRNSVG